MEQVKSYEEILGKLREAGGDDKCLKIADQIMENVIIRSKQMIGELQKVVAKHLIVGLPQKKEDLTEDLTKEKMAEISSIIFTALPSFLLNELIRIEIILGQKQANLLIESLESMLKSYKQERKKVIEEKGSGVFVR